LARFLRGAPLLRRIKLWIIRRKFERLKKEAIEPWLAALMAEREGETMNTYLKGLLAAVVGGAIGAATSILDAGTFSLDPVGLKRAGSAIIAGALLGAGAYLKGLHEPAPGSKPEK